jgi:1-acyl-sn-glycerol-3-phosphate acyltransferase
VLRSIVFYLFFYPFTFLCLLTAIITSCFGANPVHAVACFWARTCLRVAGVRVSVSGVEAIPRDRPFIGMANHASAFDILALFAGLPVQFRWMAKEELFQIPLFGLVMRRSGYIPVDRSDRKKSLLSMAEAVRRIASGVSVMVFPEGTRSPDGTLLPFKKGGFILALQAQVPILPVTLVGTNGIMSKDGWRINSGAVHLHISSPIETRGLGVDARETLMQQTAASITAALQHPAPPARP